MVSGGQAEVSYDEMVSSLQSLCTAGDCIYDARAGMVHEETITVPKEDLIAVLLALRDTYSFPFLLDLCGVDWPNREKRFDVVYHLHDDKTNRRIRVKTAVGEHEKIDSLTPHWPAANWFERECYDMFGVEFAGHPDLRRILCHAEFQGYPLRKDYEADAGQPMSGAPMEHIFEADRKRLMVEQDEDLMWINIGPAHPATHGTLRFMAVIDGGERILAMDSEIGYLHRCFEKMCETHNYNQIIPYTDRLNYCSAPLNNNAFAATVEKLLGVEAPPRAQMIRMILDEFSRIMDHIVCVGTNAVDLGALTGFFYMFNEREQIYQLFEKLCGARLTVSLTRIGGQGFDLPEGWIRDAREVCAGIERMHAEIDGLLSENRIFVQRTKGSGPISVEDAIAHGFTGIALRAAGHAHDLRVAEPYYFYKDVDFDVPVGSSGDAYERYLCRMEEIRQSLKILRWCFDNMPEGPVAVDNKLVSLPPKQQVYGNIEGLMNHFMLIINGVQPPVGEVYHAVESPNGELGFYVISDGSGTPYRVKCRPPCFPLMAGFSKMCTGGRLADAIAALGSINIIAGELDR